MAQLYSHLKFLRFHSHLQALQERRVEAPVHIRIKPTNLCNQDCWYCAYKVSHLQLGQNMVERDAIPEAKMHEIAEDCLEMGVRAVTFSGGGEPLVYKPLPDIVEKLAKGGIRVATLTNGANLKGRVAEAFAEYGTWVRISIDAWDGPSYVKARGVKDDAFDQVLDNMRGFAARNSRCVLGVSFIVTKDNAAHLYEAVKLFKQAGVNHVKLSGAVISNSGADNNAYHRPLHPQVTAQITQAQQLADARFAVIDHYHELEERFHKPYTSCPFLQFLTVIGADQRVYTCQDKAYTDLGLLGSIEERRFKDFWFSEENRQRMFAFDPSANCNHHCVSHSKNLAILEYLKLDPDHALFV
ncbi:Radical SAM domain protein [Magnetococcus marinus MC-1]|uniref:Radical SAM domain protein n=1 Tax=Magnetococcus marinus (strain ATCC BAA-1437 / JCM 17883 / MC-1) TaxID=156889 RepID=A0L6I2_MAGMM|nr:radical SAM protein [Magnetococcus marinus]ABK43575.1 Radical SAM domain protein [Magnetococcus marinus MC-1]